MSANRGKIHSRNPNRRRLLWAGVQSDGVAETRKKGERRGRKEAKRISRQRVVMVREEQTRTGIQMDFLSVVFSGAPSTG